MKRTGPRPNLPALRSRWLDTERAWRAAVASRGFDLYSDAAEGKLIGRGKHKTPDELRRLFDVRTRALEAYQGGEIGQRLSI